MKSIRYWILVGILIRLIVMPFTMHPDILHIYYHPHFLASQGVWDIYTYHADFFKEHRYHYYAPLTHIFFGSYLYLAKPFLQEFAPFMEDVRRVTDEGGGHSAHYLAGTRTTRLFRFLFLMKFPYLIFDILLLGICLKFTPAESMHSDRAIGLRAPGLIKWWALNPVIVYTSYLFGQFDIIPTFFIALGAFLAFKGRNIPAMLSLGCGACLKNFPLFLIFPFSFYMGRSIKEIFRYAFIGILPILIIVMPFYISSDGKVMGAFFSERISQRLEFTVPRVLIFICGYLALCASLLKKSVRAQLGEFWQVKVSFLTLALLFVTFPISFHYFLWLTPFVLILANLRFRIMNFYVAAILSLGLVTLVGKGMWGGLLSPIYPEFFMGLPSLDEIIKKFLPYARIKGIFNAIFIATLVGMIIQVVRGEKQLK